MTSNKRLGKHEHGKIPWLQLVIVADSVEAMVCAVCIKNITRSKQCVCIPDLTVCVCQTIVHQSLIKHEHSLCYEET